MLTGIACGLGAAVAQSLSYIASRHYSASRTDIPNQSVSLIVLMHLWLGIFSAMTLSVVFERGLRWDLIVLPLATAAVCNVAGQIALTIAIRLAEPSRVSPLLTMKVLLPAVLTMIVGAPVGKLATRYLTVWQWLAVVMCVGGRRVDQSWRRWDAKGRVADGTLHRIGFRRFRLVRRTHGECNRENPVNVADPRVAVGGIAPVPVDFRIRGVCPVHFLGKDPLPGGRTRGRIGLIHLLMRPLGLLR